MLPQAKILFNILQAKVRDIRYCSEKIRDFQIFLADKRNSYDMFWRECLEGHYSVESSEDTIPAKRRRVPSVGDNEKSSYWSL